MTNGHGYKAKYDYVELLVEQRENHWCLILKDSRHGESVEHDEQFDTPEEAQDAALSAAQHHINIQHNDTLLARTILAWQEYWSGVLDFFSDGLRRDPFPVYDQLRNACPILYSSEANAWMIFDYDGVKQALNHHAEFSSSLSKANRPNPQWLVFFDPPQHTRLRALIMRAFTPRAVADLEPRIRELSSQLLDTALESDEKDLAAQFSIRFL